MKKGLIFDIQKFCINDGPGIRTTVFFKGCNLKCNWCHNPESHLRKPELFYDAEKCVICGRCGVLCPQSAHLFGDGHEINRDACILCGLCADGCTCEALEIAGKEMDAKEIIAEVLKDKVFYKNSGGGMTLSGGEPLMQFDFVYELLKLAKQNDIHTCIETCGYAKTEDMLRIAEFTDIFLYDWKITDENLHEKYTGVKNGIILENLRKIDEMGSKIILRCPIIPGVNDTDGHFNGIADIVNSLKGILAVEIEPYHSLGNSKYAKLGKAEKQSSFEEPCKHQVENWIRQIQNRTEVIVKKA